MAKNSVNDGFRWNINQLKPGPVNEENSDLM